MGSERVRHDWVTEQQSCVQLFKKPMDSSPSGCFVHRILQARIPGWVAIPFSRVSSPPRVRTWVSCLAGRFFTVWATREAQLLLRRCLNHCVIFPVQEQRPAGASFHLAWWWGVGGTSGACELVPKNCFLLQVLTDPGRQLTTALSDVGKTLKVVPKKKKGWERNIKNKSKWNF